MFTDLTYLLLILGLTGGTHARLAGRDTRTWGSPRSGGPGRTVDGEVRLVDNPSGVNLATVMAAVADGDMTFLWDKRVKDPKYTNGDRATMIVQAQPNLSWTTETEVRYDDIPETFCRVSSAVWPCVLDQALQNANWDTGKPMSVPDALQAITGIEAKKIYDRSNDRGSVSNTTFEKVVFEPYRYGRNPYVLLTRAEKSDVNMFKPNYAYTVRPSWTSPETLWVLDIDSAGGGRTSRNYTDFIDDIESIYTTSSPLSVAEV